LFSITQRIAAGRTRTPSTRTSSISGRTRVPSSVAGRPFTRTRPDTISVSARRRDATPARAMNF